LDVGDHLGDGGSNVWRVTHKKYKKEKKTPNSKGEKANCGGKG